LCITITTIITITTTTRHQSGLDRPVSTLSDCHFRALPSRLRPFGLQFSIIFRHSALPFIIVACRIKFDLYLLSFSNSSKISAFLFVIKKTRVPGCSSEKFHIY
jgi:hypothetical protein